MSKRARKAKKARAGIRRRGARVYLDGLELARGHDGLLRGRPEPVLVVGLYGVGDRGVTLLARDVVRFAVDAVPPLRASRVGESDFVGARTLAADASHCVALLVAIERDTGEDVREVFASLERADAWRVWSEGEPVPSPVELGALPPPAPGVAAVLDSHVLLEGRDLRDTLSDDDLVGAAALIFRDTGGAGVATRARFVSEDGRNDWTALVRLAHS